MSQIITISREFGSGGRQIGEQLARELGITFYDKALIHLAVAETGFDPLIIEKVEEEAANKLLFNLSIGSYVSSSSFSQVNMPISDQIFFAQAKVIDEIASRGDCVILGRCASHILRDHPQCARVFLYGKKDDKLRRIVNEYGLPEDGAEAQMVRKDKARANFHGHYTDEAWGMPHSYDLAVNTSYTGIDGAVKVIKALVG